MNYETQCSYTGYEKRTAEKIDLIVYSRYRRGVSLRPGDVTVYVGHNDFIYQEGHEIGWMQVHHNYVGADMVMSGVMIRRSISWSINCDKLMCAFSFFFFCSTVRQ